MYSIWLTLVIVIASNISSNHSYRPYLFRVISLHRRNNALYLSRKPDYRSQKRKEYVPSRSFDGKDVYDGSIVEYMSLKGLRKLVYVLRRQGAHLDVINEQKNTFSIPLHRVTMHINDNFQYDDFYNLVRKLNEISIDKMRTVWTSLFNANRTSCNLHYISRYVYQSVEPKDLYISLKLAQTYGDLFFTSQKPSSSSSLYELSTKSSEYSQTDKNNWYFTTFFTLTKEQVEENLRFRSVLNDFRLAYNQFIGSGSNFTRYDVYNPTSNNNDYTSSIDLSESNRNKLVSRYAEGLKHIVIRSHPWGINGWSKRKYNETIAKYGEDVLSFLELAPNLRNAKKVLECMGIWNQHENIEKYLMEISDEFPLDVLEEAQYLLDNYDMIPDPDERIRRDLRYLGSYAIDNEGAAEVDDALSIEILENGQEKIWIHIADVSRWVRPGGPLSQEAERRMTSIYFPDEKISMFPEALSSELLSLGAKLDSYAVSCGVTLNEKGQVTSYEICPSKIRMTRRLSYNTLDDLLSLAEKVNLDYHKYDSFKSKNKDLKHIAMKSKSNINMESNDFTILKDLSRLNYWAKIRYNYRRLNGALDQYLKDKTELSLYVRRVYDNSKTNNYMMANRYSNPSIKYTVVGSLYWNNASSNNLVSEYMILMCQTVGELSQTTTVPIWYKTQTVHPPLSRNDLQIQLNETAFLRTLRILKHLKSANDSRTPGYHATSGSQSYVQITSPIRRFQDLYNHYRLKSIMHAASLNEEFNHRAIEEADIVKLESMRSSNERLQTLNEVKLVSRNRQQYWLQQYLEKLSGITPRPLLDCVILGLHSSISDYTPFQSVPLNSKNTNITTMNASDVGYIYDVMVLQLGSHGRKHLYHPLNDLSPGFVMKGYLMKCYVNPIIYMIIPESIYRSNMIQSSTGIDVNTVPGNKASINVVNNELSVLELVSPLPFTLKRFLKPTNSSSTQSSSSISL